MRTLDLRILVIAVFVAFAWVIPSSAAPVAGQAPYLDGLDALENKRWADAVKAFSAAVDADEENSDYLLARGVAGMIAGEMKQAGADLDRSYRLDRSNQTAQRWYAAYLRMTDNATAAARVRSSADYSGTIQEAGEQLHQLKYDPKSPADAQALRDRFENFGVQFAKDVKAARPELTALVTDRMKANFAAGKFDETFRDLGPLMKANPLDASLVHIHAVCLRSRGDLSGAREEFTRVLTTWTNYAAAYSERAIVEARLGNLKRARADLALASKYDPADGKAMTPQVEKELAVYKSDPGAEPPDAKWAGLRQGSEAGQSVEQLLPLAIELEKCLNARRLRWDEGYQDKLRELEDAVRQKPKDIPTLLAIGEFRYRESSMMGEQLGPGASYHTFRFSGNGQSGREIQDADAYFSDVLTIDAKNVMAMTWKAAVQLEHGNWDDGEAWVNKALAIRTDVPELLELLTRVLDNAASSNAYTAQDLRTAKSWWTFGINYDTLWTRTPTQDELNRAAFLDQKANEMWTRAEESLTAAVKARAGTPDGFYYAGLLANRHDDPAGAVRSFESAAKADPSRRNIDALVHAYARAGRVEDAVVTKFNFTQTRHTTATSHLAAAWTHIENTAYKKARASLESAAAIDPCDTRIAAYYASIATINQKPAEALQWYNIALAMEEAHQVMKGASLAEGTAALGADDVCLSMLMNLRAASRCNDLKRPDDQFAYLKRNLTMEKRLAPAALATFSSIAVLPNQNDPRATTPRSVQNLLAWTHVQAGYCLLAQNKPDEARAHFDLVWNWRHAGELFEVQQLACAGSTRLKWAKEAPDKTARAQWLQSASLQRGLSREEVARIEQAYMSYFDPYKDPRGLQRIQNETMSLYKYVDQPSVPGGYDPKANPNYIGTDDRGPDDAPRGDQPPPRSNPGAAGPGRSRR